MVRKNFHKLFKDLLSKFKKYDLTVSLYDDINILKILVHSNY